MLEAELEGEFVATRYKNLVLESFEELERPLFQLPGIFDLESVWKVRTEPDCIATLVTTGAGEVGGSNATALRAKMRSEKLGRASGDSSQQARIKLAISAGTDTSFLISGLLP